MTEQSEKLSMRLDKWLWCARFYKTRSMASNAIKAGKIKINGERAKPSKTISLKDILSIRKDLFKFEVTILGISKSRLSAPLAAQLYEEHQDSIETRSLLSEQIKAEAKLYPKTQSRPTKRDRRHIVKFKTQTE